MGPSLTPRCNEFFFQLLNLSLTEWCHTCDFVAVGGKKTRLWLSKYLIVNVRSRYVFHSVICDGLNWVCVRVSRWCAWYERLDRSVAMTTTTQAAVQLVPLATRLVLLSLLPPATAPCHHAPVFLPPTQHVRAFRLPRIPNSHIGLHHLVVKCNALNSVCVHVSLSSCSCLSATTQHVCACFLAATRHDDTFTVDITTWEFAFSALTLLVGRRKSIVLSFFVC